VSEPVGHAGPPAMTEGLREHLRAIGVLADGGRFGDGHDALVRPETTVGAMGAVLSRLHRADVPDALVAVLPRRHPRDVVEAARSAVSAGRVRRESIAEPYRHLSPERLVEVLEHGMAALEPADPVLTHGAPTLDRLCGAVAPDSLTDWHRAGLADPHLDLAVAARDLMLRLGPAIVPVLAASYEPPPIDPRRLDWYSLAIELMGDPPPPAP
jgi:aminoglycoside phosphotransferase